MPAVAGASPQQATITGLVGTWSCVTHTSTSPAYDGSKWTDQFPNDHGTALIHMTQSTRYSMDVQGPTTAHAVCTKH
jgi:hypothetical protein